jgi:DNA-3-methyladenine glycosylase II
MKKKYPKQVEHLITVDPVLAVVIEKAPIPVWEGHEDYFRALVETIIGQQLSGKAADTITARFNKLFPKGKYIPADVLKIPDAQIRGVGISYAKIKYIKDLAQKTQDKILDFETIHKMPDAEVVAHLTQVKGIGPWSAEMFMMFTLKREDVFSLGDLGLKNAIIKLYKLRKPTPKKMLKISQKWAPYRTWAARYLWMSLDLKL